MSVYYHILDHKNGRRFKLGRRCNFERVPRSLLETFHAVRGFFTIEEVGQLEVAIVSSQIWAFIQSAGSDVEFRSQYESDDEFDVDGEDRYLTVYSRYAGEVCHPDPLRESFACHFGQALLELIL